MPILYASAVIYNEKIQEVRVLEQKLKGIETVNVLKPLRILAAKHRGTSAQWSSGNKKVEPTIKSIEADMNNVLAVAKNEINENSYSKQSQNDISQLENSWLNLKFNNIESKAPQANFQDHSLWIDSVDALINNIATQTGLTLDKNIATHELMNITVFSIPDIQESLGQLRGIGAGVATRGSFDSTSFVSASTLYSAIQASLNKMTQEFNVLALLSPDYTPKELKQAQSAINRFQKVTNESLIQPDTPTINGTEYFKLGTSTIKRVSELHTAIDDIYQKELHKNKNTMMNSMILSLGIFSLLFIIGTYLFICLRITVDQNVQTTRTMASDLESGVLNKDYHSKSQDELGFIITALKKAYVHLRGIVSQVRNHSDTLLHSSKSLLDVSREVNSLGEEQKNRVEVISTAATKLAETAQEVSVHCENAASKMHESQSQASLGAQHSHSSAKVIRTLASNVRSAGDEIEQLAQQAASISTVIDVIKSIAEQTNLLALNAAIEAARAGEQGRGFAVVADEVRTLATRTQDSTNEIETTICSLQQVAQQAVISMETSCEQASESEAEATKTGEVLSDIENSINEVSHLIEQVATAGTQQAGAANDIAQNILAVDDAASELVNKAGNMSTIAKGVGQDSNNLEEQVKVFSI